MPKIKTLEVKNIKTVKPAKGGPQVHDFADFMPPSNHVNLKDHAGETIYIVGLEQKPSEKFGAGYLVTWRDFPNAKETYTSGVYGQYPAAQLDTLYNATDKGAKITEKSPTRTTIQAAGNSYRFE